VRSCQGDLGEQEGEGDDDGDHRHVSEHVSSERQASGSDFRGRESPQERWDSLGIQLQARARVGDHDRKALGPTSRGPSSGFVYVPNHLDAGPGRDPRAAFSGDRGGLHLEAGDGCSDTGFTVADVVEVFEGAEGSWALEAVAESVRELCPDDRDAPPDLRDPRGVGWVLDGSPVGQHDEHYHRRGGRDTPAQEPRPPGVRHGQGARGRDDGDCTCGPESDACCGSESLAELLAANWGRGSCTGAGEGSDCDPGEAGHGADALDRGYLGGEEVKRQGEVVVQGAVAGLPPIVGGLADRRGAWHATGDMGADVQRDGDGGAEEVGRAAAAAVRDGAHVARGRRRAAARALFVGAHAPLRPVCHARLARKSLLNHLGHSQAHLGHSQAHLEAGLVARARCLFASDQTKDIAVRRDRLSERLPVVPAHRDRLV